MNGSMVYRDQSHVSIGLVIRASRRDFERIQESIIRNFPDSFIAYRCWDEGRLRIIRDEGDPALRRRGAEWD